MEVSFCNPLCISDILVNNDTLRLFFKKKHLCASDEVMGGSASFVSDSSHHFPEK
nr:MAG TPA: hypothetical protein [Caudoviricetes sp.]